MIESKFDKLMRCYKGGGGTYRPPKPPSPTTAAENISKTQIQNRQRIARGYGASQFASLRQSPAEAIKTLLGQ